MEPEQAIPPDGTPDTTQSFHAELTTLLNKHNMENNSNTPDFLLASYLCSCLAIWDEHTVRRLKWYEQPSPGDYFNSGEQSG